MYFVITFFSQIASLIKTRAIREHYEVLPSHYISLSHSFVMFRKLRKITAFYSYAQAYKRGKYQKSTILVQY